MKKLNKIYTGALGAILLLSACNKQLDLKPYQQIEQSQALLTSQDVQITLIGAYNRAALSDLYGGGVYVYPDLMATKGIVTFNGTFQGLSDMFGQKITVDNTYVNGVWYDSYQAINQVNNVLANISKVDAEDKDRIEGEASFLRGMTYFDLVRLFGRAWNDGDPNTNLGVPSITTPTTDVNPSSFVKRATVAQNYAQAIADLKDAEAKLPEDNDVFASKYAASAILARLYLQKQDYANALAESNKVIEDGGYILNDDYASEFPYPGGQQVHVDNTDEDIFAIQVTSQQGINNLNTYYASKGANGGRGDIHVLPSFLTNFGPTDTRADLFSYDNDDPTGVLRCDKFDNIFGNVHIVRLAEMYLIRAEANFRLGSTVGATPLADIKTVRARAGASNITTVTLNDILAERVRELAFEGGFFLHDAKRTNSATNPVTVGGTNAFSPKLVFPIPQVEINTNKNLVQNPGYGN